MLSCSWIFFRWLDFLAAHHQIWSLKSKIIQRKWDRKVCYFGNNTFIPIRHPVQWMTVLLIYKNDDVPNAHELSRWGMLQEQDGRVEQLLKLMKSVLCRASIVATLFPGLTLPSTVKTYFIGDPAIATSGLLVSFSASLTTFHRRESGSDLRANW